MSQKRKCITVPWMDDWYESSEILPFDSSHVFGLVVEPDGAKYVAQVIFRGNRFCHEFVLNGQSKHVTHWLFVGASTEADTIDRDF